MYKYVYICANLNHKSKVIEAPDLFQPHFYSYLRPRASQKWLHQIIYVFFKHPQTIQHTHNWFFRLWIHVIYVLLHKSDTQSFWKGTLLYCVRVCPKTFRYYSLECSDRHCMEIGKTQSETAPTSQVLYWI